MKKFKNIQIIHLFWIGGVTILPILGACQKETLSREVITVADAYRAIIGEWEWESTEIHYRGQDRPIYESPDTESKTIHYVFRENGTAVKIEDGRDFIDYEFEIKSTTMESSEFHLTLSPIDKSIPISTTFLMFYNGNLILTNRLGVSSYHVRKKTN